MRNYWENNLFPQFLQSIDDCTLLELTNLEIQNQLGYLVVRAVNDFKFPKVELDYLFDNNNNSETGETYGYYFTNNEVGQKEFNVILARMKYYWIEFQISQERLFSNLYYDRDVRFHSPGNTIDKLLKMSTTFKKRADKAEFDYGRISNIGDPAIGEVNDE